MWPRRLRPARGTAAHRPRHEANDEPRLPLLRASTRAAVWGGQPPVTTRENCIWDQVPSGVYQVASGVYRVVPGMYQVAFPGGPRGLRRGPSDAAHLRIAGGRTLSGRSNPDVCRAGVRPAVGEVADRLMLASGGVSAYARAHHGNAAPAPRRRFRATAVLRGASGGQGDLAGGDRGAVGVSGGGAAEQQPGA